MRPILEICAADIDSVVAAAKSGADRVELCSALGEGGITPSAGLIAEALKVPGIKVNVLIRPRGGDFLYTPDEVAVMEYDIKLCREMGANGVVIGALTPEGDIDMATCRKLIAATGNMSITFHRAIDVCRSVEDALEQIVELGCHRILTSGHAASAMQGVDTLRQMVAQANGRIAIMAGGGVNPGNAAEIICKSGATEIHGSAKSTVNSLMKFRTADVNMGTPGADEYSRQTTSAEIVAEIVKVLDTI